MRLPTKVVLTYGCVYDRLVDHKPSMEEGKETENSIEVSEHIRM